MPDSVSNSSDTFNPNGGNPATELGGAQQEFFANSSYPGIPWQQVNGRYVAEVPDYRLTNTAQLTLADVGYTGVGFTNYGPHILNPWTLATPGTLLPIGEYFGEYFTNYGNAFSYEESGSFGKPSRNTTESSVGGVQNITRGTFTSAGNASAADQAKIIGAVLEYSYEPNKKKFIVKQESLSNDGKQLPTRHTDVEPIIKTNFWGAVAQYVGFVADAAILLASGGGSIGSTIVTKGVTSAAGQENSPSFGIVGGLAGAYAPALSFEGWRVLDVYTSTENQNKVIAYHPPVEDTSVLKARQQQEKASTAKKKYLRNWI